MPIKEEDGKLRDQMRSTSNIEENEQDSPQTPPEPPPPSAAPPAPSPNSPEQLQRDEDVETNNVDAEEDGQPPDQLKAKKPSRNPVGMTDGDERRPNEPQSPLTRRKGSEGETPEDEGVERDEPGDKGNEDKSRGVEGEAKGQSKDGQQWNAMEDVKGCQEVEGRKGVEGMTIEGEEAQVGEESQMVQARMTTATDANDALHDPGSETKESPCIQLEGERDMETSRDVELTDVETNNVNAEEDEDDHKPSRNPVGMMDGDERRPNEPTEPPNEKEGERGANGELRRIKGVEDVKDVKSRESR
ncbi:hypothetical protein PAXINDRAFT_5491 [Paxillus involutus ATCC 200175]|nr:hypothetical protein PAXINDRAFT_5491 [Paxillus involutus ATCC 200175]